MRKHLQSSHLTYQDSSHPDDNFQLINFMLLLGSNDFLVNPTITYVSYQTIWLRSKFHCINITSLNLETTSVVQGQTSARADIGKHQRRYPFTVEIWALSTIDWYQVFVAHFSTDSTPNFIQEENQAHKNTIGQISSSQRTNTAIQYQSCRRYKTQQLG